MQNRLIPWTNSVRTYSLCGNAFVCADDDRDDRFGPNELWQAVFFDRARSGKLDLYRRPAGWLFRSRRFDAATARCERGKNYPKTRFHNHLAFSMTSSNSQLSIPRTSALKGHKNDSKRGFSRGARMRLRDTRRLAETDLRDLQKRSASETYFKNHAHAAGSDLCRSWRLASLHLLGLVSYDSAGGGNWTERLPVPFSEAD